MKVKIVVFVPLANADELRQALGDVDAGKIGEYSYCSFSVTGIGRFIPSDNTAPHIGEAGILEQVEEERIEVTCNRSEAKKIVKALQAAHPYEEPSFDIYPLLTIDEL